MAIIYGTAVGETLDGTLDDDDIYGFDGNDILKGGAGNDILLGGSGADIMRGGTGDDIYVVDTVLDVIFEVPGEDHDSVISSISYVLGANVEDLFLEEGDATDGTGNGLDNALWGNSGNNTLKGGAGKDFLNGDIGADIMKGGTGDDAYAVDNTGDVVSEAFGQGTDLVDSAINYVLPRNVEGLILIGTDAINGTGNDLDNFLYGNVSTNTLKGGAGNDSLDGMAGADKMQGGTGDDTYSVDNVADIVTEALGQGNDLVQSSINYVLPANVESLLLTGTDAINGTGNGLDNYLGGNVNNNTLKGGAGNDTIWGGTGLDKLTGGTGSDLFYFVATSDSAVGASRDVITDFSHVQLDLINVSAIDSDDSVTGDQAFTFIGNAAFSAAGQLRYDALTGIIQGNVNSTLTPDFEIKLTGAPVVDATDFVL